MSFDDERDGPPPCVQTFNAVGLMPGGKLRFLKFALVSTHGEPTTREPVSSSFCIESYRLSSALEDAARKLLAAAAAAAGI